LQAVNEARPDLVLLDLTLPDIDGLDVCRKIRAEHPDLPIMMLTAREEEMDVIVGLNAGADDYVAKPFRLAELVARIRARLRIPEHTGPIPMPTKLVGAGITLDATSRRCQVIDGDGTNVEVELTTKEFDLLALLMQRPNVTIKREEIMAEVWDKNWWGSTRLGDGDFTADVTHQLRTGLTGGAMRLEILERHNDPEVVGEAAAIFDRPTDHQAAHGRGLSLARRLTEADGGRLELEALQPATFKLSLLTVRS
jgi:DNA-binding response OmpR family regulator